MAEQLAELNKSEIGIIESDTITENGLTIRFYKMGNLKAFSFSSGSLSQALANLDLICQFPSGYECHIAGQQLEAVNKYRFTFDLRGIKAIDGYPQGTALRGVFLYF